MIIAKVAITVCSVRPVLCLHVYFDLCHLFLTQWEWWKSKTGVNHSRSSPWQVSWGEQKSLELQILLVYFIVTMRLSGYIAFKIPARSVESVCLHFQKKKHCQKRRREKMCPQEQERIAAAGGGNGSQKIIKALLVWWLFSSVFGMLSFLPFAHTLHGHTLHGISMCHAD